MIDFEKREETKKNELIEVILLYPREDLIFKIQEVLEKDEKIIKRYAHLPGVLVKLYPEKIEKIKRLYPEIVVEENLAYSIDRR